MSRAVLNEKRSFPSDNTGRHNNPSAATPERSNTQEPGKGLLRRRGPIALFVLFFVLAVYFTLNAPVTWQDKEADAHNMLPALLCFIFAMVSLSFYPSKQVIRNI